jgi:5'-methylthioinosine phosphorylase
MLGIIGGSGLSKIPALQLTRKEALDTPYGATSANLQLGQLGQHQIVFLPRHGEQHQIPPHKVNYRANIWAMQQVGVTHLVGVAAAGGITALMLPGAICVADQIIDYTYGREHTYFVDKTTTYTDFTEPYCEDLRQKIIHAAQASQQAIVTCGVYAATQGPRLESAAEIRRLKQDGCDLVGMTGMPEAALAKEIDLCYANISLVVNWAAGVTGNALVDMQDIRHQLNAGMEKVVKIMLLMEQIEQ